VGVSSGVAVAEGATAVFVADGFRVAVGAGGRVAVSGTLVITGDGSCVWTGIDVSIWFTWVATKTGSGVDGIGRLQAVRSRTRIHTKSRAVRYAFMATSFRECVFNLAAIYRRSGIIASEPLFTWLILSQQGRSATRPPWLAPDSELLGISIGQTFIGEIKPEGGMILWAGAKRFSEK